MQIRPGLMALLAVALACVPAAAQTNLTDMEERLRRAEQRLDELEQQLKARDAKIAELELPPPAPPATQPSGVDDIERTKAEVLRDIESRSPAAMLDRTVASFTPDVAVITDFVASVSGPDDRDNEAYNRFDVREAELDLRAPVDSRADGVLIVSFERDVHNPIFPEAGEDEEEEGVESSVNLEEAYLFLHDFGVPNLTAKLGRFHVRFGRQNLLHLHDVPTTDPPFVNQAFLAPEALTDAGLSLSYVIPPRYTFDQYVEVIAEAITGEGAESESPTLAGDLSVDSPAVNLHVLWNTDVTRDVNLELGASWLTGHTDADNANDLQLFGIDATLLLADPSGGFNNRLLQAEAIYGHLDAGGGNHAVGAYLLGQQQLDKDWYVGIRFDWTENPTDDTAEAWGITPYVSWYWSEMLRFRASYQHRDGDVEATDAVWLQATWIFGAHPAHPYWSMR